MRAKYQITIQVILILPAKRYYTITRKIVWWIISFSTPYYSSDLDICLWFKFDMHDLKKFLPWSIVKKIWIHHQFHYVLHQSLSFLFRKESCIQKINKSKLMDELHIMYVGFLCLIYTHFIITSCEILENYTCDSIDLQCHWFIVTSHACHSYDLRLLHTNVLSQSQRWWCLSINQNIKSLYLLLYSEKLCDSKLVLG